MQRPNQHLADAGKLYPNAWRTVDQLRQDMGKGLPSWPNWCYMPMSGFYSIVSADTGVNRLPIHLIGDVANLAALGTWRISQGIYRFDEDFEKALIASPITGSLPVDVLYRLPEWCVYVETHHIEYSGKLLNGFFAHLEWDVNTGRSELRLLPDTASGFLPVILHMGNWTVIEALDRVTVEASKQLAASNMPVHLNPELGQTKQPVLEIRQLLSLILYICSEKPEYSGGIPSRPQPKNTKKHGLRMFPPDKPKIIEVGKSIGDSLRAALLEDQLDSSGRSVRAHIRRGHWHGYWIGKKDGGEQKFVYNWLPPIAVNSLGI